jgi:peptidyl-prolyl cis-trans isomerase SurA
MRFNVFCTAVLIFAASIGYGQDKNAFVMTVAGEGTTLEEFENIFKKNNRDSLITHAALDEYMELFINFKLKVKEARELKLDTVAKFKEELRGYRDQLARPYLTDSELLSELIKEAYQRKQQEVRAMHILVKCESNASSQDTLRAYNKIMAMRDRITMGEDFATIAKGKDGSDDPSAKENGGDLGYFTAFQMVYQFEDAAYNTPVGQISMPVRTKFGYHIIKVVDKRPAQGEMLAAHIMVKAKPEADGEANAITKINEIYEKLKAGEETFENLAAKYSEDGSSAKKGGELPWFGTGNMVMEFEQAAFALQTNGEYSRPFKTSFGWHIAKRLDYRPVPAFDAMEKELKSKVSKDARAEKTKKSFVEKLKKEYNYSVDTRVMNAIAAKADTNAYNGSIKVKKKLAKKALFNIDGKTYKAQDFLNYFQKRGGFKTTQTPAEFVKQQMNKFGEALLLEYEDGKLESKHTAFRLLMKEYREGILLFELTDQKVWNKAVKDSTGLTEYYEKNKSKFMWPERVDVVIYTCANDQIAVQARKMLAEGKDKSTIAGELNEESQLNLQIEQGTFAKEDRDILSDIEWKKGLSKNLYIDGQVVMVDVLEILPTTNKRLDEAKGLITSDYQTFLEQEWIQSLRAKYPVSVDKNVLYTIH